MPGLLRTVASLPTPEEAHAVRLRLDAEGIEAVLADETTVGMNWLLGGALGQVKVQVAERDYARAMHLLVCDEDEGADDSASVEWTCGRCGAEMDAGFDVCWSCGAMREAAARPPTKGGGAESDATPSTEPAALAGSPLAPPPDVAPALPPSDDERDEDESASQDAGVSAHINPYRSPRHADPPRVLVATDEAPPDNDTEAGDAAALRSMRAAIFGIVVPSLMYVVLQAVDRSGRGPLIGILLAPMLHGYSGYLLLKIGFFDLPLGPRGKRHFAAALIIDLLAAAGVGIVLSAFSRMGPLLPAEW